MNFIKIIFKTYLASCLLSYVYLFLIHEQFYLGEIGFVLLALFFGNAFLAVGYVIGILLPFNFLFKQVIAANSFKMVLNKYLFYFSLLPVFLIGLGIMLVLQEGKNGMQFSLLVFDLCSIIYTGLIYLLKNKTAS